MSDITKKPETLPETIRQQHIPQTGDIYLYKSPGRENIRKIVSKNVREGYTSYETVCWSFLDNKWEEHTQHVSDSSLEEYYTYCLTPLEDLLSASEKILNGEPIDNPSESTTEELVLQSNRLNSLLSDTEMLEDRMKSVSIAVKARINEQMALMEQRMKPMKEALKSMERQLKHIRQAISIVEIYQGQSLEVTTLVSGKPASIDTPITIRQRILFMDEECAVLDEDGQGMDYWTRDRFYDWVIEPSHRDIIVPEERCAVVLKPRRYNKRYSSLDSYEQRIKNEWNRHSFILIRNGENLSVIESEDLCIYDATVPRKADFEKIRKEAESWKDSARDKADSINYRCIHLAMVLQGLCDHTDIFAPQGEINFVKGTGTQIIYDDEQDTLLGTERPDFPGWLNLQSHTVRRGSRIIYIKGYSDGFPYRDDPNGYNWNHPKYRGPKPPDTGLYTLEAKGSHLGFTYLPADEIYSEEGLRQRKRRETWIVYREKIINYDTVTAEELKGYLEDRTQRQYYAGIIPILRKYLTELEKEQEYENLFLSALTKVLDDKHINHTSDTLLNALKWWKNKVIHIRPISSDDDKAWRMILSHITKQNNT